MANSVIKTSITIDADIASFERGLSDIQAKMDKLALPTGLSRNFQQQLASIREQIEKLKDYTANSELTLVDAKKAATTLDQIQSQYRRMISSLSGERLEGIISKEDTKRLTALSSAIEKYKAQIGDIFVKEEKLAKARDAAALKVSAANALLQKQQDLVKKAADQETELEKARQRMAEAEAAKSARREAGNYNENSGPFKRTKEYKEYQLALQAVEQAEKALQETQSQVSANPSVAQLTQQARQAQGALDRAQTSLTQFQQETVNPTVQRAVQATGEQFKKLGLEAPTTAAELKTITDALTEQRVAAEQSASGYKDLTQETSVCAQAQSKMKDKIDDGTEAVKKQNEANKNVAGFVERIKQFTGLSGAMMVFRKVAQQAYQAVKELDEQMTEMAVVTNQSVGDYWKQMPEHTKRANELGLAIKDVYEAETLYYQQGLKTNEVVAMSNSTLRMARIAGLDAAEATDKMTAALRGFNMELNGASADRIADVYSKLAAITASNVDEISTAMTKTASIASSAGMEFETTAAFLSQIIETTRESAETAGTALKTVIARFQELKKDPSEIGEVDGEIVDANKIETALKTVGVELRDTTGQFRNLDTVFMELAQKWDGLDKNTQRYIATIAAGSRQQSRFIAMMSDYSRTTELVDAAQNAAGASADQFAKTQESLENKINRLKNAWTEFTTGLLNNEVFKILIDALTGILNVLNKITDAGGTAFGSVMKLGLIVGAAFAAKAAISALAGSFVSAFTGTAAASVKATSAIDTIKLKVSGLSWDLKALFAKKGSNTIQIRSDQVRAAQAAVAKLKDTQYQLINTEKALKAINDIKNPTDERAAQIERTRAALLRERNELIKENIAAQKALIATGLTQTEVEAFATESEAVGLKVETYAALAKKGYTKATIEKIATLYGEQGAQNIANISGVKSWILTKLRTKATEWENKGILRSILATRFKALAEKIEQKAALGSAGANISLAGSIWACVWPILVVIAILAVLIGLIILIMYLVKRAQKNSPEGRLQADKEALEAATEAANSAAEAYKNLSDSVKDLKSGYEEIDQLTKGTEEWQAAVDKVNEQVMSLIEQCPELIDKMDVVDGVMVIAEEDLDNALKKAKETTNILKANQIAAQTAVEDSTVTVKRVAAKEAFQDSLAGYQKDWTNEHEGELKELALALTHVEKQKEANVNFEDGATIEEIKEFMKKQGLEISDRYAEGLLESMSQLKAWGEALDEAADQVKVASKQIAKLILEALGYSAETNGIISGGNDAISESLKKKGDDAYNTFKSDYNASGASRSEKKDAVKEAWKTLGNGDESKGRELYEKWAEQTYGKGAIVNDYGEVFKDGEEQASANRNMQQWLQGGGLVQAGGRIAELYKKELEGYEGNAGTAVKKFADKATMTGEDLDALQEKYNKAKEDSVNSNLTEDQRQVAKAIISEYDASTKKRNDSIAELKTAIGIEYKTDSPEIKKLSGGVMAGFASQMKKYKISTSEANELWQNYATQLNGADLTDADRKAIGESFNKLNLNDQFAIDQWKEEMRKTYRGLDIDWDGLANGVTKAGKALYRLSEEEIPTFADNMNTFINGLRDGSKTTTVSAEDWEKVSKGIDASVKESFIQLNDGSYQFIGTATELADAMASSSKRILKQQYDVIDQDRQAAINALKEGETLTEAKEKEFLRRRQQAALSYGQTLGNSEIKTEILDTLTKATTAATEQERAEAEAEYKGLIQARAATAAQAGVDADLIANFQAAAERKDSALVAEYMRQINDALFEKSSAFSKVNTSTDKLKATQDALTNAQNQYNKILNESSTSLKELTANLQQQEMYLKQVITDSAASIQAQEQDVNQREAELERQYSKYGSNVFVYDEASKTYSINSAYQRSIYDSDDEKGVVAALKELNDKRKNIADAQKEKDEAEKQLKELQKAFRESMGKALEKIEGILEQQQKDQIDELTKLNETLTTLQSDILKGMKESVELERQIRDNTETENDIADKEARLAYLMADSSGANAQEILELQQEIEEDRQDQMDTLIDQKLDEIEDANEKAAEQRQQQIDLLTEQLERDKERDLRVQAYQMLTSGMLEDFDTFMQSDLAKTVQQTKEYLKLTEVEKKFYMEELYSTLLQGASGISALGLTHYATGGMVTSTGPAWLDGTPSRPEIVLNSQDAKNFLKLKDILAESMISDIPIANISGDTNNANTLYVDVDINVDSLANDYDVDRIANHVRDYIVDEALYRNTTSVINSR